MEASTLHAPPRLARPDRTSPSLLRLRSDDQLVALFRLGHDEAFCAIHDRYRRRLLAYARQLLGGSRSDAEDALQDVFERAYAALRRDARPVNLRAWLYRVAHNRCIDELRRPAPPAEEAFEITRPPLRDTQSDAERREALRRLVADVQRLPAQQREALLMRELEGRSYAELAQSLGVSVGAVKSLLMRARTGLVEASVARDADCDAIQDELLDAFARRARASAHARRHQRECAGCRAFAGALHASQRRAAVFAPPSPIALMAKLLGLGGAGSTAAASAGAGGSAAVLGGGAATVTASKVVAAVCCAAVVGGGAAEVGDRVVHRGGGSSPARAVVQDASAPARSAPAATAAPRAVSVAPAATAPAPALGPATDADAAAPTEAAPGPAAPIDPAIAAQAQTGGLLAPAEDEDEATEALAPTDPAVSTGAAGDAEPEVAASSADDTTTAHAATAPDAAGPTGAAATESPDAATAGSGASAAPQP